jgi:uncharacterized membrane protein
VKLDDAVHKPSLDARLLIRNRVFCAPYALALAVSISTWFIAIRAALRLDETGTYWQISAGFSEIWPRQGTLLPVYQYILWLSTKIIGSSEIALRIPSIITMFTAVYLLYLAARELFERDVALIAVIVFCLDPIVVFTSIDVRPYAFAVLATNAAILVLLRLRRSSSIWLAALFGTLAALILWFHLLLGVILPALMLSFIALKCHDGKTFWKQLGAALAAFVLAFLPVIPGLIDMFRTSKAHIYEPPPAVSELLQTFIPGRQFAIVCCIGFVAFLVYAARTERASFGRREIGNLMLCASLALIPALILFGVSKESSAHVFTYYHRLSAVPGIALSWAFGLGCFRSRNFRLLITVGLAASTAFFCLTAPYSRLHQYSPKYAIEVIEKNASVDGAPVVMCSGFIESNYVAMPSPESVKDSQYFAPLSYYRLSAPVIPLPQFLSNQTIQIGSRFLNAAALKHERFLVTGDRERSADTLQWFIDNAAQTHTARDLGEFQGIEVLEFVPRSH